MSKEQTPQIVGKLDIVTIGNRLRRLDRFIVDILRIRLAQGGLSDYVAFNKMKGITARNGIFEIRRQEIEDKRIGKMKKWAVENNLDPNFMASLMYQIMSESCRRQDELMVHSYIDGKKAIDESDAESVYAAKRRDLLRLTSEVAPFYDQYYAEGYFGTKTYLEFEREVIQKLLSDIGDNSLAVDFGCATGSISLDMAKHFKKVIGYDISPEMISVANSKKTDKTSNVEFIVTDIENEINLPEESISLAIMNLGTASEIRNIEGFLKMLKKALRPGGKFLLSFYNPNSLFVKLGFLPWPLPLAAYINFDKRCLEVHYNKDVYILYARPRSVESIKGLLAELKIENICTYPTCASILPEIAFNDEDDNGNKHTNAEAKTLIEEIDKKLASSDLHSGTYVIVTGSKDQIA